MRAGFQTRAGRASTPSADGGSASRSRDAHRGPRPHRASDDGERSLTRPEAGPLLALLLAGALTASSAGQVPVTVYEDEGGIPHVASASDAAVLWALGRQHMLDFPVTTAFHLWYATGQLASKLGIQPGVDEYWLELDRTHLLWRIPERVAQHHVPQVLANPALAPLVTAYVAGLNAGRDWWNAHPAARAGLAGNTAGFPLPAAAIQRLLATPLGIDNVLCWALAWPGFGSRADIDRLVGIETGGAGPGFAASNGWIVSRNASVSGNPMMVSDPHLPGESPPFYRGTFATLHGPTLHAGGWFFPGIPFPGLGFNEQVSWTATANGVDHHDVWAAETDSLTSYTVGAGVEPVVRQTATVSYMDLITGLPGTRVVSLAWADPARDLPVLHEDIHPPASPHYSRIVFAGATFVTADTSLLEFLGHLAYASSIPDVQDAVDTLALPDLNLLALHQSGDMGYWWLARDPVRPPGAPGVGALQGVLDGNDPAHRWSGGVYPASALPRELYLHSPTAAPEVWINNNVGPEWVRPGSQGTIVPSQYPLGMILSYPWPTWRQERARQLLMPPVSAAENRATAVDQIDPWLPAVAPHFQQAVQELRAAGLFGPDPLLDAVVAYLAAWDGQADRHSFAAAFAYLLRTKYEQLLAWNQLLPVPFVVDPTLSGPYVDLPPPASLTLATHPGDVLALGLSVQITLYELYPAIANPTLQNPVFTEPWTPQTPWIPMWSPTPWSGYGPLLELGHIKMLDLTPPGAPFGSGAFFPVGGSKDSLFQTGSWDLPGTLSETYTGGHISSALAIDKEIIGTTRLLVTEFTPSGPVASYLAPLGPTEIGADPRRYLPASAFAARQLQPLHFDLATIMSPTHALRVTSLLMPP